MVYKLEKEESKPSTFNAESIHRLPAQAAKGAAAALPGFAGDLLSLPYSGVNKLVSSLGGSDVPYEESILGKILPTTQTHTQNLEEGIPYLKPKNKVESFVNDVASDAVSLVSPGKGLAKIGLRGTSAAKGFITSLGANSAGEFVSDITGDSSKGAYAKMGSMFLFSALNKPGAQKEVGKLYQKADQLLPDNAIVKASRLESDMQNLKSRVLNKRNLGDLAPSEKFVVEEADTILRQIQNGEANVGTLKSSLRSLNEKLQKAVFDAPDKSTKVRARKLAKQINKDINHTLSDYGQKNPEWWKAQKSANEGFATLQQSNFITNFIENNIKHGTVAHGVLHALGIGVGAAAFAPYQAARMTYQIANSPALARHYARVVSSAAAENAPLMRKELKELDEAVKKESEKSRYRLES